jgi:hypothetical protein
MYAPGPGKGAPVDHVLVKVENVYIELSVCPVECE